MKNRIVGTTIILGTLLVAGCDTAQKAEKEAREAQQKADEVAAKARENANETAAQAQAKANDLAREADRTLVQRKSDFRIGKQKELDELNRRIDEVRAKAMTAKNDVKASIDAALAEATQRRATVESELRSLENAPATDLDQVEDRINQTLAQFKKSVSDAEKRI
jgi:outer membrane murein-binding lipoprotein Lpp